ncbi:MAG: nicotinate phosphoribosyltransferase [Chloroflexi bacterium]|nr:nicotinate phosphoribosyltransferase [Chloroflexota bacterium]
MTHDAFGLDRAWAALFTDLYELTMAAGYFAERMHERATFSLFFRRMPAHRAYLVAAGLETALRYLERFRFSPEAIAYLGSTGRFEERFLGWLADLRFTGTVRAIPEGRLVFENEPLVEVTAPIVEAQIVETFLINAVHYPTLVAAKAARCVDAAAGRDLVDFGLRRTPGVDAGMAVARSSCLVGFGGTSNVLAGAAYGIPIFGTMAHSYVQAFPNEIDAFRAYARAFPDRTVLLIDTYDTIRGAELAATVGREMAAAGHRLAGVRLDSGDLLVLSRSVRAILDQAGLNQTRILASGNVDEEAIQSLLAAGAPIDAFGVGTRLAALVDAPMLDMAYKLVAYAGRPVMKLSAGKATLPGGKQVWRRRDSTGAFAGDIIATADEPRPAPDAEPLLEPWMVGGRLTRPLPSLEEMRARHRAEKGSLPPAYRQLAGAPTYPVRLSPTLRELQMRVQERLSSGSNPG